MNKSLSLKQKNKIAQESDNNIDKLQRLASISYLYLGAELKRIKEEKLYIYMGEAPEYESFEAYVNSKNIDLRKAYYLMQIHKVFIEQCGFKPEELFEVSWTSLRCLLPVLRPENAKELVEKAKTLTRTHLESEVKQLKSGITTLADLNEHKCTFKKIEYWKCTVCGQTSKTRPADDEIIK